MEAGQASRESTQLRCLTAHYSYKRHSKHTNKKPAFLFPAGLNKFYTTLIQMMKSGFDISGVSALSFGSI